MPHALACAGACRKGETLFNHGLAPRASHGGLKLCVSHVRLHAFACRAATRRGTNLFTQNIFLLPLTTTTSPPRSRLATCCGSSVAGSSCQPSPLSLGSKE